MHGELINKKKKKTKRKRKKKPMIRRLNGDKLDK